MAKKEEGISEKAVHTKGPWKIEPFDVCVRPPVDELEYFATIYGETERGEDFILADMCGVASGSYANGAGQANAHLIAAAPELLSELEHICAESESWHSMHHAQNLIQCDSICKAIPAMKSAIQKARRE